MVRALLALGVAMAAVAIALYCSLDFLYGAAVGLWLVEGLRVTTSANLFRRFQWRFGADRCYSELPVAWRVWQRLERRLIETTSPVVPRPVRELPAAAPCEETLDHAERWHEPWVMRKAKPFAQPMSPLYIARHANRSMLDVTAISLDGYLSDWAGIAECPGSRKQYHGEVSLADVLRSALNEPGSKPLYTNFDEAFLASNSEEFAELRRHMLDLRAMCGLDGWVGEAFFGFGSLDQPYLSGTPYHAAVMGNLFMQVHGRRTWTLIDPRYSQYMRPLHGSQFIVSTSLYTNWSAPTPSRERHLAHVPRHEVVLSPGDVLWVPPWWWHEVYLAEHGFSFGASTRGMGAARSWRRSPVLRFLPWVNGGAWSADKLALDAVHAVVWWLGSQQKAVEASQHTNVAV